MDDLQLSSVADKASLVLKLELSFNFDSGSEM